MTEEFRRLGHGARRGLQCSNRPEQLFARAERQTELFEVTLVQLRQYVPIDLISAERVLVTLQAQRAQPSRYVQFLPPRLPA